MARNGFQTLYLDMTAIDGTLSRDAWLSTWGRPSEKKVRDIVAKSGVKAHQASVVRDDGRSYPEILITVTF